MTATLLNEGIGQMADANGNAVSTDVANPSQVKATDPLHKTAVIRDRLGYKDRQSVYDLINAGKLEAEYIPPKTQELAPGQRRAIRVRESAYQRYLAMYQIPEALPLPGERLPGEGT